jgi:hypothetical protein
MHVRMVGSVLTKGIGVSTMALPALEQKHQEMDALRGLLDQLLLRRAARGSYEPNSGPTVRPCGRKLIGFPAEPCLARDPAQ